MNCEKFIELFLTPLTIVLVGGVLAFLQRKYQNKLDAKLEELKAGFQSRLHVHSRQFDKEMDVYEAVWEKMEVMRKAMEWLRPIAEEIPSSVTKEQHRIEKHTAFKNAFDDFQDTIFKLRPFYPEAVYDKLIDLKRVVHEEGLQFVYDDPTENQEYWANRQENIERVVELMNEACEAIRGRLAKSSVV